MPFRKRPLKSANSANEQAETSIENGESSHSQDAPKDTPRSRRKRRAKTSSSTTKRRHHLSNNNNVSLNLLTMEDVDGIFSLPLEIAELETLLRQQMTGLNIFIKKHNLDVNVDGMLVSKEHIEANDVGSAGDTISELSTYWKYIAPYCTPSITSDCDRKKSVITTRRAAATVSQSENWLDPNNIEYDTCLACSPSTDLDLLADDAVYEFAEISANNTVLLIKAIRVLQKEKFLTNVNSHCSRIHKIFEDLLLLHQQRDTKRKKAGKAI